MLLIGHTMEDDMKLVQLILICFMVSCSSASQSTYISEENSVGWLHGNCLAIKQANLPFQKRFILVHLNEKKRTEMATVVRKVSPEDECPALLGDRGEVNMRAGYHFYWVESEGDVDLAIGMMDQENIKGFEFSFCTTLEGIMFSVSRGINAVVWSAYYYLGYESKPTCAME